MDYLERLDKIIDDLEKEANKLDGISELSRQLASMADEVAAEKKEVIDVSGEIKKISTEFDSNIGDLKSLVNSSSTNIGSNIREFREDFAIGKEENKKNADEIKNKIDFDHKEVLDALNSISNSFSEKQDALISELHETKEAIVEEAAGLKASIEGYQVKNEKTDKLHTILLVIAVLLALISCCIPFIQ